MIKHIPNAITSLNLLCGGVAILFTVSGDLIIAAVFVFLGIFFDFFDGLAARMLKAQSDIGMQLDSLADVVTCGVVPSLVMVQLLQVSMYHEIRPLTEIFSARAWQTGLDSYFPLIGLLILVASAYRLAKFNVDTRQTTSFIGLPTPANTLFILSLPMIFEFQYSQEIQDILFNKWFLVGLTVLSSFLLNAEIPLFAFKFKTWGFKENKQRYLFLLLAIVLLALLKFLAIPIIIILYVLISLVWKEKIA
ncbi:MAG: CDP-alcohol phosphatidyltransferase family protein [Flavobacteriaceae bacterium]|nr:CDP-alcohol phosphatidyltransferase family protein [Flavobacteriaceae bacterium]